MSIEYEEIQLAPLMFWTKNRVCASLSIVIAEYSLDESRESKCASLARGNFNTITFYDDHYNMDNNVNSNNKKWIKSNRCCAKLRQIVCSVVLFDSVRILILF